jgi:hypothetical protein
MTLNLDLPSSFFLLSSWDYRHVPPARLNFLLAKCGGLLFENVWSSWMNQGTEMKSFLRSWPKLSVWMCPLLKLFFCSYGLGMPVQTPGPGLVWRWDLSRLHETDPKHSEEASFQVPQHEGCLTCLSGPLVPRKLSPERSGIGTRSPSSQGRIRSGKLTSEWFPRANR